MRSRPTATRSRSARLRRQQRDRHQRQPGRQLQADSGAVYVFVNSGGVWTQQAYVKASNTDAGDQFGISVALSADGNTLAVGADYEDSNATGINGNQTDNSQPHAGAVYVFTRSGTTWTPAGVRQGIQHRCRYDWFGIQRGAVDDGNTLAVGAPQEDSNATGINGNQSDNSTAESRRGLRVHPLGHDLEPAGVCQGVQHRDAGD